MRQADRTGQTIPLQDAEALVAPLTDLGRRAGTGSSKPQPESFVQLLAIDRDRQRAAEIGVGDPSGDLGIAAIRQVEHQLRIGAVESEIDAVLVLPALLVLEKRRKLRDIDEALLDVVLARDRA